MTGLGLPGSFSTPTSRTWTEMTQSLSSEAAVNWNTYMWPLWVVWVLIAWWLDIKGASQRQACQETMSEHHFPLSLHSSGRAGHSGQLKAGAP